MERWLDTIGWAIRAVWRLLGAVLLAVSAPSLAQQPNEVGLAPTCHAYAEGPRAADMLRSSGAGWICAHRNWHANAQHSLLRFELPPGGVVPAEISTRLARFEFARIDIDRADGTTSYHYLPLRSFVSRGNMRMSAPLPEAGTAARRITVQLSGATVPTLLSEARLYAAPHPVVGPDQVWVAVLIGVLLVPLFFNLALYRALGDRFLLWQIAVVGFLLVHSAASSGLFPLFGPVPVGTIAQLIAITFCGGAASALMLASDFIERSKMDKRHRRALRFGALWLVLNGAFFTATVDWLQGRAVLLYYSNWLPVVAILIWTLGTALIRGSRAVRFLLISWLPLAVIGLWQIFDGTLGNHTEPAVMFIAQRIAIGLEVLIGSIAIADRFIQLRRDRDDQELRASAMARLAERDPLTGLLNRRAIEDRFTALRADGFATLAVIDLDHFKAINDCFGHSIGDQVLRVVAATLPEDDNVLTARMGGEEFLLLLRGEGAVHVAERLRQAIPARVAHEVPGLDQPVTASMGLVEIPAEVMPQISFAAIYARADGLLYQAKRAGRNRLMSERMRTFARQMDRNRKTAA